MESNQRTPQAMNSDASLLDSFRKTLAQRGARGIIGLRRVFKIYDDDGSGSLSYQELWKGLNDYRVKVTQEECKKLFRMFDVNGDGSISYDELLRGIAGNMDQFRTNLVKKAFAKLDANHNGVVDINDLKGVYNAKKCPDVISGKKTEEEVLGEFLDTFEMHYSLNHPNSRDRTITWDEFYEYYNNVSASIDNDQYFELMMNNAWNLDNKAPAKKAWHGEN